MYHDHGQNPHLPTLFTVFSPPLTVPPFDYRRQWGFALLCIALLGFDFSPLQSLSSMVVAPPCPCTSPLTLVTPPNPPYNLQLAPHNVIAKLNITT